MSNMISYKGTVILKTPDNKILYQTHNAGTDALFSLLYNFLLNNSSTTATSPLPSYISIVYADSDLYQSLLTNLKYRDYAAMSIHTKGEINVQSRSVTVFDELSGIKFAGLLTHDNISTAAASFTGTGYVLLLDGAKENILAFASFDMGLLRSLTANSIGQASIEWLMSFSNSN